MGKLTWNEAELRKAIADAAEPHVREQTEKICQSAKSMSAGYRTGLYHPAHGKKAIGNTSPKYRSNVRKFNGMPIGLVYTGNYSAMKDNYEHNTLLKARG